MGQSLHVGKPGRPRNVRFTPLATKHSHRSETSFRATSKLMHRSKRIRRMVNGASPTCNDRVGVAPVEAQMQDFLTHIGTYRPTLFL
jgi:hypothetical protein